MTRTEKLLHLMSVINSLELDDDIEIAMIDKTTCRALEDAGTVFCLPLLVQIDICLDDAENPNIKFKQRG